jgi:ribose-phosphate pyrophosphokinase
MIKLLINDKEVPFEITKFPDGTSQVWKITKDIYVQDKLKIQWLFENEAELFHLCQLIQLLSTKHNSITLEVPYLPFARQDKEISNESSFAISTFAEIMSTFPYVSKIESFDVHSQTNSLMGLLQSRSPRDFHASVFNHDVVCFPDKGAAHRYKWSFDTDIPVVYCEKVRDQLTGNITGLKVISSTDLTNKSILIVDDICDGGMTFIKVTEELNKLKPKQVDLAVSHGLFSKGKACLYDVGISNIYTTNSLLRNPDGFKVW